MMILMSCNFSFAVSNEFDKGIVVFVRIKIEIIMNNVKHLFNVNIIPFVF